MSAPFSLPLPYADNALEPMISATTLSFHYGKPQGLRRQSEQAWFEGKDSAQLSLEDIIKKSAGDAALVGVFQQRCQIWNTRSHWNSLQAQWRRQADRRDCCSDR